ncbi:MULTISPECIES: KpsF/GutQ family sugar-phosphate isomerase [Pseudoalteromonas]|jgi:arabinose-5-phosphate isomerase|uniref:KpsF/GutQ family sugar-phosphate isomerase n=1 Tax=Pseudoalteromonas TaxID=53246 RepID=UPI000782C32F|nr:MULTISPECIES: KpsF/GutQ family sugar-phosphate isomerase [Pseudoalteromonas]MCF7501477.1 KpsF/GutQ family sugar-phosphate isomerase [Pseudoalteromonas sp. L1]RZF94524.1 KpsF/GutQ family sugar-phosphate isomerase [Pseudoalteromonas sp. CO302Y]RZG11151.1 KpsF/GutQ family sugar-phosphate isomerase [Pseudoalteromonas sp. CO133X]UJX25151.1 KpsF/GutQ family sugar-phosphate isomerase [Pseudoalteromonas sp. CF6-2]WOC25823.1 KpsF/GutQ family sugar-phosphate isomerase [Pseudoalteromonas sp. N1230-9]|tara:strand:- start:2473 stop:3444 length:972 start_codon:yes stop_codon:yes gene_type:complete
MTQQSFIAQGKRVLEVEAQALREIEQYINADFEHACQLMFHCTGRIIVIGMGKSGHIGNKIAATLASTGTPAFFVHPGEASHGDLGMITREDVVMCISNSGETSEVLGIIPVIKRIGAKMISLTGNPNSTMGKLSDVHVCIKVSQEACPLGLAPTASTTATLVMGDAIAVALLEARGFTADDFALSHPGGSLGKRLLLSLEDVMHTGSATPIVTESQSVKDALIEMSAKGLGMTAIVDENKKLAGLFTDGDLRRILEQRVDIHNTSISQVMTRSCTTAHADMLAAEALNIMERKRINGLIIIDESNTPIGALNMQDLLKAGVL